ncbi:YafY family transcriptional regulator [Massilia sp. G4R7]|uniref:YafY family transcriptional regulator n=1 Tax=Massilia phyllostachyos TaxID=2898585 RepID=A0ABS8Q1S1_9BURK|nr:YafY family protein [Massilia phyllostachyos]MCD2515680.1 YafY family transcriptional regulator [Massilia phyllostachyos]
MSRSERLFRLLQALRTLPAPVTAARLAQETGVSVRSVYRDIDSLRASGAGIGGERGYGYTLVEDGALPPQMFDRIEIEALVLGLAEVRQMGDPALAGAANAALAKIAATLPSLAQQHLLHAVSQAHRFGQRFPPLPDMALIRDACWRERALRIRYTDRNGEASERTVWPLAIMYLENILVLLARCCLRQDFRMFRLERIESAEQTGELFRPQRAALLRAYLARLDWPKEEEPNANGMKSRASRD